MRLVLLHIPECSPERVIEAARSNGAHLHPQVDRSWLFPPGEPSMQLQWPVEQWPQSLQNRRRIEEALHGRPFSSLEVCVSVGSPTEPVRQIVAAILDAHGGVAQIELGQKLWSAPALRAGTESAASFAAELLHPAAK